MAKSKAKLSWPLIGNGHIFEFLAKSLAKKNIASSYIFTGPSDLGKTAAAHYFARSLVCQSQDRKVLPCGQCPACGQAAKGLHGDIYLIKKPADKKNISIDQIRDFIRSLGLSSFLNSYKIGIIKGADSLSESAVNALLKTLEEPKIKVVIILTVDSLEALPKTIISRSQILRFSPVAAGAIYDDLVKNHGASRSLAKDLSRLAAGRPALAWKFLEDKEYYEDYRARVSSFGGLLSPDINQRFGAIEKILSSGAAGQEAVESAVKTIDIWQNLTRDLMLLELSLADLVQHEAFLEDLAPLKNKLNLVALLNLTDILKRTKLYLGANVNPKLALESLAVSF